MTHLPALEPAITTGKTKDLFNAIEKKLGMVPNMMRTMGNSYAVLNGYLSFSSALGESKIGARMGEQIALIVAETNSCNYCLAAHTFIGGKLLGINDDIMNASRIAGTADEKTNSGLRFARQVVIKKGKIGRDDIAAVRQAGYTDAEIAEIIAHTALNIFTNYFNIAAGTEVDFPKVDLLEATAV